MERADAVVFDTVAAARQRAADPSHEMKDREGKHDIVKIHADRKLHDPCVDIHKKQRAEQAAVKDHAGRCIVAAVEKLRAGVDGRKIILNKVRKADKEKQDMAADENSGSTAKAQIDQMASRELCFFGHEKYHQQCEHDSYNSCNLIRVHGRIIAYML